MDLEELLHRHVLLRAGEGIGDLAVDPVLQDPVAGLVVGRMLLHELVEGRLGVEHHRPELALHLGAVALEELRVHLARLVVELAQPERVGEPLGWIDGQHRDLLAAGCEAGCERR
jgi:hypothetical protein